MSDTLTTLNWLHDQERYMAATPLANSAVLFLRDIYARSLSADGAAMCLRLLQANIAATTEIEPAIVAPLAQRIVYGMIRRALWYTYLAIGTVTTFGEAEPVLSEPGLAALIAIETQDPVLATPADRQTNMAAVFAGLTWRVDTIDLGVDTRAA